MTPEEIAEKILNSTGGYRLRHKRAAELIRTHATEAYELGRAAEARRRGLLPIRDGETHEEE